MRDTPRPENALSTTEVNSGDDNKEPVAAFISELTTGLEARLTQQDPSVAQNLHTASAFAL